MRRHHLFAVVCSAVVLSCSNDSPTGTDPGFPDTPTPANHSVNQSISPVLSWHATGGLRYNVYLGTSTKPERVAHEISDSHYQASGLKVNTVYYWRVDNVGTDASVGGPLWSFTTHAGVPPAPPTLISPADGNVFLLDEVVLTWSPEPGDSLVFNVYLGTSASPPRVAHDITRTSYTAHVLGGNTYNWRVESKDHNELVATSPTRQFTAAPLTGHMYNVAGTGKAGLGALQLPPLSTQLKNPQDVAFDPSGQLVVVDYENHRVLLLAQDTRTFNLIAGTTDGKPGEPCAVPGPCDDIAAIDAKINHPTSVTFRPDGMMVLAAWRNHGVFLVDPGVKMTRIAGTGTAGYSRQESAANASPVDLPSASVYTPGGEIVFADQANSVLRRIDASAVIHRFAGQEPDSTSTGWKPHRGFSGDGGPALDATFNWYTPNATSTCGKLAIDAAGNIYVADTFNHAVRKIDAAGNIHRFAGVYPAAAGFGGDGGPATSAHLDRPRDVACDANGNVFIADTFNNVIRMVAPDGIITTVAGIPNVTGLSMTDGKLATESGLNLPFGIDIDAHGNLWIADTYNSRIRVVYR